MKLPLCDLREVIRFYCCRHKRWYNDEFYQDLQGSDVVYSFTLPTYLCSFSFMLDIN